MTEINNEILASRAFESLRRRILLGRDKENFPTADIAQPDGRTDWDLAIFLASALDDDGSSRVQQAVMDISFAALSAPEASEENKVSAALILERFGNWPSINLAIDRKYVPESYRRILPLPLRTDSIMAKIEHTVTPASGDKFLGSRFQRMFWKESQENEWLSLSAPTATGKSYVVRRWVIDQALASEAAVVLYIVPTRALVDEVYKELLDEDALQVVHIHSIPWDSTITQPGARILVMTQERAQITLESNPAIIPTAAFIDEAQKMGDGYRGMLLEEVVQESVRRSPNLKAVFASPMTSNPEILLTRTDSDLRKTALSTDLPSVNQSLYWLNPISRRSPMWAIERSNGSGMEKVGEVSLGEEPSPKSVRLAALPAKLAAPSSLNIVYANTAADAEACAKQIYEYRGPDALEPDDRIAELQDLIRNSVHPSYLLIEVVSRGVAFHYGNMPQSVRNGIEGLYRDGLIKFLVCTSTLLEGVNLPCTNIWVMNPRRGKGNPMTPFDFWNLAGRAGRWGSEFSGNIICIGTGDRKGWPNPPVTRSRGTIAFATEVEVANSEKISEFIRQGGIHPSGLRKDENLEAAAAHLFNAAGRGEEAKSLRVLSEGNARELEEEFRVQSLELTVPGYIRRAHPGINPQAMQRLLDDLVTKNPDDLPLLSPHDDGAFVRLVSILNRCERNMRAGFGIPKNQARLAMLLLSWMKGSSVPRLISERINFERDRDPDKFNTAKCIRAVLEDVEQVARFRAPKFLGCYTDIVEFVLPDDSDSSPQPDVTMMLELGVSRRTQVSLMSLGISRNATLNVSEFIATGELGPSQVLDWLEEQDFSSLGLPALLVREVDEAVKRARSRRAFDRA